MGFYGNITNTNKTTFTFDKTYPNRKTMDTQISSDQVYLGRYVLVEYGISPRDTLEKGYLDPSLTFDTVAQGDFNEEIKLYTAKDASAASRFLYRAPNEPMPISREKKAVTAGELVYVLREIEPPVGDNLQYVDMIYFECSSEYEEGLDENGKSIKLAKFKKHQYSWNNDDDYARNYNIDKTEYGNGRGYDSTVWQKVFVPGVDEEGNTTAKEQYVMIAELNSVVPTFDLSVDQPTMYPIVPHFDIDSTNVYYKLHTQPQWGFRVKSANPLQGKELAKDGTEIADTTVDYSTNKTGYPSDEMIDWVRTEYDAKTGIETKYYYKETLNEGETEHWVPITAEGSLETAGLEGAIYYNKAGFNPEHISITDHSGAYIGQSPNYEAIQNHIKIEPTGQSGHRYNLHSTISGSDVRQDIQELSIILPSIGNSVAQMWDIVYGNHNINANYWNMEQEADRPRNMDLKWGSYDGLRAMHENAEADGYRFDLDEIQTLAGCINSVHDLMGMIIDFEPSETPDPNGRDKIYYNKANGTFERVYADYEYTDLEGDPDFENGEYYVDMKGEAVDRFVRYQKWNNEVKEIPDGITLTTRKAVLKYEPLEGFARSLNTIHGLILKINDMLEYGDIKTRDQATVQGAINVLNDIIVKFDRLTPKEFMIVNKEGRLESSPYTTKQLFTAHNEGNGQDIVESEAKENQWIYLNIDEEVPLVYIEHRHEPLENTIAVSNLNKNYNDGVVEENLDTGNGNNANPTDDSEDITNIKLYTPIVDGMGHIVGKNTETVKLPNSFKYIKTIGAIEEDERDRFTTIYPAASDEEAETEEKISEETSIRADFPHATLTVDPGNKWVQTELTTDNKGEEKLSIYHEVHAIDEIVFSTDLNNPSKDTFSLQDLVFDRAGHVIENHKHTYTLPYGYKTFTTTGSSTNTTTDLDSVQDTVSEDGSIVTPGEAAKESFTVANNTQDSLSLNPHNKWIQIQATDDNIVIAHEIHGIQTNPLNDDINGNGDIITFQDLEFDKAGHVTKNQKHTYTLPYGFKTITTNGRGTETSENALGTPTVKEIVADNTQDSLAINSGNKWIRIDTNADDDSLTIRHDVHNITINKKDDSDLDQSNNGAFTVQDLMFDEAGHVTANQEHKYLLPHAIRNVQVYGASTSTDAGENSDGFIEAIDYNDTLELRPQNRWIVLKADKDNRRIDIGHAAAGNEATTVGDTTASTPEFGTTFNVPYVKYDEMGHIKSSDVRTVMIPKGSLTDTASNGVANVLTSIDFNATTGAITTTHENVGTLSLTGYNLGTDVGAIGATDTVNAAMSKLQAQINKEVKRAADEEQRIESVINQEIADRKAITDALGSTYATVKQGAKADSALQATTAFAYGEEQKTIQDLFTLVFGLSAEVTTLRAELNALKEKVDTEHPEEVIPPEEGGEEVLAE